MDGLVSMIGSAEFWMGLSLIAAAMPGPQTRIFPAVLRAIGRAVAAIAANRSRGGS